MQSRRNAVRAPSVVNAVKVLSVVNVVRAPSVVNVVKVLSVVNVVRAPSVVNVRREQAVSADRSPVAVVVREGQVVLCGCSL